MPVVTLMSKASVLNVCGMFTAREFQTRRGDVAKSMEDTVREDLEKLASTRVLSLNLRNIERPKGTVINCESCRRFDSCRCCC